MRLFVLDACAVLAYMNGEKGGAETARVLKLIASGKAEVYMHRVNFLEVYNDVHRNGGKDEAERLFSFFENVGVRFSFRMDDDLLRSASSYKLMFKMSFADSFVLALAEQLDADVVTSDHHEFDSVEKAGVLRFLWIR